MKIELNDVLATILIGSFAFCFICCGIGILMKVI